VVADEDDEDAWDVDIPAWANVAIANATADRRKPAGAPRAAAPQGQQAIRAPAATAVLEAPSPAERNALDRRTSDRGPPGGQPDRRQARSFGRRPTH
jgi:hypothetical protein